MNKETKKILKKGIIALLLVAVIAGLLFLTTGRKERKNLYTSPVGADTIMTSAEGYFYYNDADNNIWRREISTGVSTVIREGMDVISASANDVLVSDTNQLVVLDTNGGFRDESYPVVTDNAQITDEYIYYKNMQNNQIMKINRETGSEEVCISIEVDKFLLYGNEIVFTIADRKCIYVYDMTTGIPVAYFGDKEIVAFDVDDDHIIYSDAKDGYKVSKMSLITGEESTIGKVKSKKFEFANGKLFYIENVKSNKDEYKLKINDEAVH